MSNFKPYKFQKALHDFGFNRLVVENKKGAGILADPGTGKTATTLMLTETLQAFGEAQRVLVIAPLRVIYGVWPQEITDWGFDLSYSIVHGTPNQRTAALHKNADIYLTNPHNIDWLSRQDYGEFDLLVVDESTEFKNWTSGRTKALRRMLKTIPKRVIMTGTPSDEDADLFAQMFILDDGDTLGKTVTYFRDNYMRPGGYHGRSWVFKPNKKEDLRNAIAPMVYRLDIEDNLDMPPKIFNKVWIDLPNKVRANYKELEEELFYALDNGEDLVVGSGASKYSACKCLTNGGLYETDEFGGNRETHHIHNAKVDAAVELIEGLQGKRVLLAFQFHQDLERLQTKYPDDPVIMGGVGPKKSTEIIARWNAEEIPLLLVQPESMKFGLNMQHAGCNDVIWFGLTEKLITYKQFNARVWRNGVKGAVRYHHILARNTIDEAMWDRLQNKSESQTALLDSLKKYRERHVQGSNA